MSLDTPLKAEKDYSEILEAEFPKIETLAKNEDIQGAVDQLLLLEKKTRQASDIESSKKVLTKLVQVLVSGSNPNWKLLSEQLTLLSKKHGQLKLAIQKMVQEIIVHLELIKEKELKIEVIENIRTVTENKIHVEVERARVSLILSNIRLEEGDLDAAIDILCELQVEAYGGMKFKEKVEFILRQVELTIRKGDFEQAKILSRKILERFLTDDEELRDLKIKYYELRIKISLNDFDYLETAKLYLKMYAIKTIKEDETKWKDILINIVYFIILSPFDNHQHELLNKIYIDLNLKQLGTHYQLIKSFIKQELIRWTIIKDTFGSEFKKSFVFSELKVGEKRFADLKIRVVEHNLRILSKYYSTISIKRINELLEDLSEAETEKHISDLVYKGVIFAKINRPQRIVSFTKPKDSIDLINEWSTNVDSLFDEIEAIGHLITKEEIIQEIKA